MKKLAIVFVVAVIGPSLALGWLATRSLRNQEIVVNSQRALLHQAATDALASDLNTFLDDVRVFYSRLMDGLVKEFGPDQLTREFDEIVRARWGQATIGCAVAEDGRWLSPNPESADPAVREFFGKNRLFLTNQAPAEVYQAQQTKGNQIVVEESDPPRASVPEPAREEAESTASKMAPKKFSAEFRNQPQQKVAVAEDKLRSRSQVTRNNAAVIQALELSEEQGYAANDPSGAEAAVPVPADEGAQVDGGPAEPLRSRNVRPLGQLEQNRGGQQARQAASDLLQGTANPFRWSSLVANRGELFDLIGEEKEGALSRFLEDGLHVLLWRRHALAPDVVFWVELDLAEIRGDLTGIVHEAGQFVKEPEVSLALLDDKGAMVAQTVPGFATDWGRPFVATEVGEILPHWEVAAYLLDPDSVTASARGARMMLWLLVPFLLVAIAVGGLLIFREIDREMRLARQKTDFVSNVSHELKTPLTSIRMFSELLSQQAVMEAGKRTAYAGIISKEAARLTRLINNLLDFSRMERGGKKVRFEPLDAGELARETVENYRHQIESDGFDLAFRQLSDGPLPIEGDRDALSQVLLNLLSNAEKYGGEDRRIDVEAGRAGGGRVEIRILDRGRGISRRHSAKIFEKFFRVDDSLSSGIEGSGLGLTLARQIARSHGGDVEYRPRRGGGSCFALVLPSFEERSQ